MADRDHSAASVSAAKAADAASADDDLDILHPERTVTVGGRDLCLHEYGLVEGLRLRPLHAPLVAALADASAAGDVSDYESVLDVLALHADSLAELIAASADIDAEFVRELRGADADLLVLTWWSVNRDFFSFAVVRRMAIARAAAPAGPTSTSVCAEPASVAATSSGSDG